MTTGDYKWEDEKKYLEEQANKAFNKEPSGGLKYDDGKLAWHLLPLEGTEEMVKVMMYGAKKYGDYNWYLGMDWHRLFNAGLRHMWSWFKGEEY